MKKVEKRIFNCKSNNKKHNIQSETVIFNGISSYSRSEDRCDCRVFRCQNTSGRCPRILGHRVHFDRIDHHPI